VTGYFEAADTLVPLELAVPLIFWEVYGSMGSIDKLNGLAMAVAALATVYQSNKESPMVARVVPPSVMFSGMFLGGGKELRFVDGRAPLVSLGVKAEDVSYVIGVLRQGFTPDDHASATVSGGERTAK